MKLHHKLIQIFYYPAKPIISFFYKKKQFRIMMYHDINDDQLINFKKQLIELRKNWHFIKPEEFDDISEIKKEKKNILLLTFDDGFKSSVKIANILKELNIFAIFFIVNDFIGKENYMNLNDLQLLISNGHTIGAHTKSHKMLSKIKNNNELEEEIYGTTKDLSEKLNINIDHFAFTFGNINAFDRTSTKIAKLKYKYVFSGIRGNNFNLFGADVVYNRDNIEPNFGSSLIDFLLKGFTDVKFASDNAKVTNWVKNKNS
jgi:peptidoglycan/xylan/chitin deacetylase (PgdA/CDA1 family)